jgi:hypothetical protein
MGSLKERSVGMSEDMTLAEEAKRLAAECRREAEVAMSGNWHLPGNEYMQEYASRMTHVANVLDKLTEKPKVSLKFDRRLDERDLTDYQKQIEKAVAGVMQEVYR